MSTGGDPYIPKKHRPRFARDPFDYRIAEENSIQQMKTQVKKWTHYADISRNKCNTVDHQVYDLLNQHPVQHEKEALIRRWGVEVKAAEEKAVAKNLRELDSYINLTTTDPYTGYVAAAMTPRANNGGFYKRNYYNNRQSGHVNVRNQQPNQQMVSESNNQLPTTINNNQAWQAPPPNANPVTNNAVFPLPGLNVQ